MSRSICVYPHCGRMISAASGVFCDRCWQFLEDDERFALKLAAASPFWSRRWHGWRVSESAFVGNGVAAQSEHGYLKWQGVIPGEALADMEWMMGVVHACHLIERRRRLGDLPGGMA